MGQPWVSAPAEGMTLRLMALGVVARGKVRSLDVHQTCSGTLVSAAVVVVVVVVVVAAVAAVVADAGGWHALRGGADSLTQTWHRQNQSR